MLGLDYRNTSEGVDFASIAEYLVLLVMNRQLIVNIRLVAGAAVLAYSCIAVAQTNQIGLFCPEQNQLPRILYINLSDRLAEHFSLSRGVWDRDPYRPEIRIDEIVLLPDNSRSKAYILGASKGVFKIVISRITLELTTNLNADYKNDGNMRQLSCSMHTVAEIREMATREYARLNTIRAF